MKWLEKILDLLSSALAFVAGLRLGSQSERLKAQDVATKARESYQAKNVVYDEILQKDLEYLANHPDLVPDADGFLKLPRGD